jgi:hypothetical protein
MTTEQLECEKHFTSHTIQQPDGRFMVRLPLKAQPTELGKSCRMAENRLLAIERRLDKDPALKKHYHKVMKDYEAAGHMKPSQPQEGNNTVIIYLIIQCLNHQVQQPKHVLFLMVVLKLLQGCH